MHSAKTSDNILTIFTKLHHGTHYENIRKIYKQMQFIQISCFERSGRLVE